MNMLDCHSGTKYSEIIDFLNQNKGKKIDFHFEYQWLLPERYIL